MKTLWLHIFIQPIYNLLVLAYWPFRDLGIAIVLVTILIRVLLCPLFHKQMRSQKEMSELQKDLQRIKDKFKGDPRKIQEETIKLYQTKGVNPLGGCLPTLLQIPIFVALYQVFRFYLAGDHFDLLYSFVPQVQNISLVAFGFIDLTKPDYYVLPYLVGLTQYFLSRLMSQQSFSPEKAEGKKGGALEEQMQAMSRSMLYFMPLFLVAISFSLPAAVVLYFLVSNLFSLGQYYFFYKREPKVKIKAKNV